MKVTNIRNNLLILFALSCLSLTSIAVAAESSTVLPEFFGGVKTDAVWQDADFFPTANRCAIRFKCGLLSQQPTQMAVCQNKVKSCISDYMIQRGASTQAIAFMRFNAVPSVIDNFKDYNLFAIVHAKMQWADADGGFFIISKSGQITTTFNAVNKDEQATGLRSLWKRYPRAKLWNSPLNTAWPVVKNTANGTSSIIFKYPVKNGCAACATLAYAEVAFVMNEKGQYTKSQILKVTPLKNSEIHKTNLA